MSPSTRRAAVLVLGLSLLSTACGLKPEVKDQLAQAPALQAGAVDTSGGTQALDPALDVPDTAADAGAAGPATTSDAATTDAGSSGAAGTTGTSSGSQTVSGGTAAGQDAPTTGGGETATGAAGQQQAEAAGPVVGGTTTGVDNKAKKMKIYVHGPLTGAGIPAESFKSGAPKYWKTHKPKGYTVEAEAIDDQYAAGPAAKACNRAAKDGFLIIGGAGTDQIQACGQSQVLQRGNVPYLSAGVTENGLKGQPNYFATSLTYSQQAGIIVEAARRDGYLKPANGKGWALVIANTPNFNDAKTSISAELKKAGVPFTLFNVPKSGGDSTAIANQLREGQFQTVYFLAPPLLFIEVAAKTGCPAYCPFYTGIGPGLGANALHTAACNATGGQYRGQHMSPWPGLDMAPKVAPGVQFKDDIEFSIYGVMEIVDRMLQATPGPGFTREALLRTIPGKKFPTSVFAPTDFTRGNFGGTAAYALRSDCAGGRYKTNGRYVPQGL